MCKLKSGIILKDRVYIPDHDHHTQMLDELKIKDTRENAERLFVRAELYPKDGDIFSDPVTWIYRVDQDILPDWYVAEVDEARMREAVKAWYAAHVHIDKDGLTIDSGVHWIKGGKNICICDSATVECICDSATVERICGSATVKCICDSATVERICGSATVERICGSATVITGYDITWTNLDNAVVRDDATIKDCYNKRIIQAGAWTFETAEG